MRRYTAREAQGSTAWDSGWSRSKTPAHWGRTGRLPLGFAPLVPRPSTQAGRGRPWKRWVCRVGPGAAECLQSEGFVLCWAGGRVGGSARDISFSVPVSPHTSYLPPPPVAGGNEAISFG